MVKKQVLCVIQMKLAGFDSAPSTLKQKCRSADFSTISEVKCVVHFVVTDVAKHCMSYMAM